MGKSNTKLPHIYLWFIFFLVPLLSHCSPKTLLMADGQRAYNDFIIVQPDEKDDMKSLANRYLKDPDKDWLIAAFNGIAKPEPDQALIIPVKSFEWGGLKTNGYQLVPILAYQGFALKNNNASERVIYKSDFEKQMKYLKDNGFRVITLDQFFNFLNFQEQIPEKSVVITLDDGWKSSYDIAYPILRKYNYPATLFVCTDLIGKKEGLDWNQVKEMSAHGIDIQCGTKNDYNLNALASKLTLKGYINALEREINEPRNIILKKIGKECQYFAYPQGETNSIIIALLKKYGFRAAFTEKRGSNPFFSDQYRIQRSLIHGTSDLSDFKNDLKIFQLKELQ